MGTKVPKSGCEARKSEKFLKSYLKPGAVVIAETDKKAPNRDKKGLLRFLIYKKNIDVGLGQVGNGYASVDTSYNYAYQGKYERVEDQAQAAGIGYTNGC